MSYLHCQAHSKPPCFRLLRQSFHRIFPLAQGALRRTIFFFPSWGALKHNILLFIYYLFISTSSHVNICFSPSWGVDAILTGRRHLFVCLRNINIGPHIVLILFSFIPCTGPINGRPFFPSTGTTRGLAIVYFLLQYFICFAFPSSWRPFRLHYHLRQGFRRRLPHDRQCFHFGFRLGYWSFLIFIVDLI